MVREIVSAISAEQAVQKGYGLMAIDVFFHDLETP